MQGAIATASTADNIENDYSEAVTTVSNNYAGDIDYEKATQAAIQGMLFTLDPHSVYFPYSEFKKLKEDQDSRFYGIGVTILQHRDGVYVQSTVEGTPAARAGLKYGDRIVEVDGKDAREWSSEQVSKNVRGARGEPVRIKVERVGSEAGQYFTIVRDSVPLPSIRNEFMIRPGTGYVGLTGGFNHTTDDELRESLATLKAQGMHQLILDLRNNPGGLLDQAIDVSSEFLPRDQVVVSVKGRSEYSQPIVYRSKGSDPEDVPLVVLINRNTASASEIVAGAIQDHGRGLIVGETSFGKGLVQKVFQLPFNTGLTLTTARYTAARFSVITPTARFTTTTSVTIRSRRHSNIAARSHLNRQVRPLRLRGRQRVRPFALLPAASSTVVAASRRTSISSPLLPRPSVAGSRKPHSILRGSWPPALCRVWKLIAWKKPNLDEVRGLPIFRSTIACWRPFATSSRKIRPPDCNRPRLMPSSTL